MGINKRQGFTILETVLVLAITGLLIVGILVGSGVAINRQRYRDSITSFESLLQQQYSQSANVVNSRTALGCDPNAVSLDACRGRSDSIVAGRVVTIAPPVAGSTASKITVTNILASPKASPSPVNSAIDDINNYDLQESPADIETSETAWGTTIVAKGPAGAPISTKILIVRAPTLGTTLTFVGTPSGSLSSLIDTGHSSTETYLCFDPGGIALGGHTMAVRINPYAATANAIEIPSEGDDVCA